MTPASPLVQAQPAAPPPAPPEQPAVRPASGLSPALVLRLLASAALVIAYYGWCKPVVDWLTGAWLGWTGTLVRPSTIGVWLVAGVIAFLVVAWRKTLAKDKRFHAPLLITSILFLGEAAFSILDSHHSTLL